ncbi:MAG: membrane dipeptidase [bacterium]|nr:membrane dipeptidase [bacterium]
MNREHLEHMLEGGVTAANVTVTIEHGFHKTVDLVHDFQRVFAENADIIRPVRSVADIRAAKAEGRVGIIHGTQNATPIEGDIRLVKPLHLLGIRIIQLAYMTGNLLGDGCLEPRNAGLTVFGRRVVHELNRRGILIDLSHCGERTTLEAIEESEQPVAFTHACARSRCTHPRNKSDEAMKALAARGGVMGITSLAAFVADDWRDANLTTYLDQVEYAVQLMGIDHVGLGMDFVEFLPASFLVPARWGGVHVPTGLSGLTEFPIPYSRDVDDSRKLPNVTAGLLERGYSEADVRKVLGDNFLRLLERVWSISDSADAE